MTRSHLFSGSLVFCIFLGPVFATQSGHCPETDGPRFPGSRYKVQKPLTFAIADADGDGDLDLITADNSNVVVRLGADSGHFGPQLLTGLNDNNDLLAVGDFDQDGVADVAHVLDYWSTTSTVEVFLGLGDGSFGYHGTFPASLATSVAVGDIDGDGKADLVMGTWDRDDILLRRGVGGGNFATEVAIPVGEDVEQLQLVDVDDDGDLDILYELDNHSELFLRRGFGNGFFAPEESFTFTGHLAAFAAADWNEDGETDILISTIAPDRVLALYGTVGTGFLAEQEIVALDRPIDLVLDDWNGDGHVDLAVPYGPGERELRVCSGAGDGTVLQTDVNVSFNGIRELRSGDLNGDGVADLVALDEEGYCGVHLGSSGGRLGGALDDPGGVSGDVLDLVDLDGDGHDDVVSASYLDDALQVRLGLGGGHFGTQADHALGGHAVSQAVGDWNEDGHVDVVVGVQDLVWGQPGSLAIFLGVGDGTFTAGATYPAGQVPEDLRTVDFDADGHLDLVVSNRYFGGLQVRLGLGDGTFGLPVWENNPLDSTGSVAIGDYDGDGELDLCSLFGAGGSASATVWLGVGDGTFVQNGFVNVGSSPQWSESGDFDGDGHLDLVVSRISFLSILRGVGDGSFHPLDEVAVEGFLRRGQVIDLDEDGALDVVVSNKELSTIEVLMGQGDATFLHESTVGAGLFPVVVRSADLDGDGHLDLVSTSRGATSFSVVLGRPYGPQSHGISAPNSVSSGSKMGWSGSRSVSANDLVLQATDCPPGQFGLFFYGPERATTPFGPNGYLNIGPGSTGLIRLTPAQLTDAGGAISRSLDFTQAPLNAGAYAIHPGSTWSFQFWYRDPGNGFNLSDALEVTFCP